MTPSTSRKGFHKFIGLVNYYCNISEIISHKSVTLTKLMYNKVKSKWTEVEQNQFPNKLIGLRPVLFY